MKKYFAPIIALILVFTICNVAFAKNDSYWRVKYFVDEFGDPTDEQFIVGGPFHGTFSNSVTNSADLTAYIFYSGEQTWIRLFEYDNNRVSNIFSDAVVYNIAAKAYVYNSADADYSPFPHIFHSRGTMFSKGSDIYIYYFAGTSSDFYSDDYELNFCGVCTDGYEYNTFDEMLGRSKKITFSIERDDSLDRYLFTIDDLTMFRALAESTFDKQYLAVDTTTHPGAASTKPQDSLNTNSDLTSSANNPFNLSPEEIKELEDCGFSIPITEEEYNAVVEAGILNPHN